LILSEDGPSDPIEKIEKTFFTLDGNLIIAEPNLVSDFSTDPFDPEDIAYFTPFLGESSNIDIGEFLGNCIIKKKDGTMLR